MTSLIQAIVRMGIQPIKPIGGYSAGQALKAGVAWTLIALLLVGAAFGFVLLTAPPAEASAYSCTGYGPIKVPIVHTGIAQWCGETNGSSLYVSTVKGGFSALVPGVYLCDTKMKVSFYDLNGKNYLNYYSGIRTGCGQYFGAFKVNVFRNVLPGYVAISLLSSGATVAKVHHNIRK